MCAAITTTAVGLGLSGLQTVNAFNRKEDSEDELNNYDRQNLDNTFKNIKISTVGSDLLREQSSRTSADLIDAAKNAGARGIFSSIPKIVESTNSINQEARKYLDDQVIRREYAVAGDDSNIRDMKERRDEANIAGLSSQVDAANQDFQSGLFGLGKTAMYAANNLKLKEGTTGVDKNGSKFNNPSNAVPSTIQFKSQFQLPENNIKSGYNSNPFNPDEFTTTDYLHRPNNFFNF